MAARDVAIIGAGPCGLSAALLLGRCRRQTTLFDGGPPRNAVAPHIHGFLTQDGTTPHALLGVARDQLRPYDTVELQQARVEAVRGRDGAFEIEDSTGRRQEFRKVLLATGVTDELPSIRGAARLHGRGLHHCVYCDAWELRDQPLAVYGRGQRGFDEARVLRHWSPDIVLCTDGPAELAPAQRAELAAHGIRIREDPIRELEGTDHLTAITFESGDPLPRRALFFNLPSRPRCELANGLGCDQAAEGAIATQSDCATTVPGVYAAGDADRDVMLAIVAAGDGARAAVAIHQALLAEDWPPTE